MKNKTTKSQLDAGAAFAAVSGKKRTAVSRRFQQVMRERDVQKISGKPVTAGVRPRALEVKVRNEIGGTRPVTIRLDVQDIQRAEELAKGKGLKYQTYIKMLLHEALAAR